jgi:hypothetical protein
MNRIMYFPVPKKQMQSEKMFSYQTRRLPTTKSQGSRSYTDFREVHGSCHIICVPLRARSPDEVVENSSESHVERGNVGPLI